MFFDSTVYLVFLVLVTVLYWRLRFRAQNCFLLLASYFFYGWWDWRFLLLMMFSTVVDYFLARKIAASTNPVYRKTLLTVSLVLNSAFSDFLSISISLRILLPACWAFLVRITFPAGS